MNVGLLRKAFHETWPTTLFCLILASAFEGIVSFVLPSFQADLLNDFTELEFIRKFLEAMLGAEITDRMGPETFLAIPWLHPVILAVTWAHPAICCSRTPAGEIDAATIDLTLGLPVSRRELLVSETILWIGSAIVLLAGVYLGNLIGSHFAKSETYGVFERWLTLVNFGCLLMAVASLTWLVASLTDRRGVAMTVVFGVLLAQFLLNYLTPFWEIADRIAFLSLLHYYQPLEILRDGVTPWSDMVVLLVLSAILWVGALYQFSRRDIATV